MTNLKEKKTSETIREDLLLERALSGDSGAARELFELYRPRVRRIMAANAPQEEVDDLVQETMIAGWSGLSRFHGKSSLLTWLAGIGRNLRSLRARTASRRIDAVSLDAPGTENVVQRDLQSESLETVAANSVTAELLYSVISKACTPPQQQVLILAFQGEALDDIGSLMQMSSATVRSHNRRGRCKFLSYLLQNHVDLLGGRSAIAAAWDKAIGANDEAKRPDKDEQSAWTKGATGDRSYCGAVLKLARYLQYAAMLAWIWLGVKR